MSSIETMAMLCASTSSYAPSSGVSSAADRLSRSEFAFLLSGLSAAEVNFALARYCGDESAFGAVVAHVQVYAVGLAVDEGWQVVKGRPTICNLARFSVYEMVSSGRCTRCQGRGVVVNRVCRCCSGSGYARVSGRKLEACIGVNHAQWLRYWSGRYDRLIKYMQTIDSNVNIHVSRKSVC